MAKMMKLIRIMLVSFIVFSPSVNRLGFAANRLIYENFDDQKVDPPLEVVLGGGGYLYYPNDYTFATGRGGTGYAIFFRLSDPRDHIIRWMVYNDIGIWPTDECYISCWMRYPDYTPEPEGHENFKYLYNHWPDATHAYLQYSLLSTRAINISTKGDNAASLTAHDFSTNGINLLDGQWHHYEFYTNFATGVNKHWIDGVLFINDNYGANAWSSPPKLYRIAVPSIDAEREGTFSRQIDDWEVWDGMPTDTDDGFVAAPLGLTIIIP